MCDPINHPAKRRLRLVQLLRFLVLFFISAVLGLALNRSAVSIDQGSRPAGFGVGVVHGVLMPCAFPALILGKDVAIYSQNNNGRGYKLGYTVGVDLCGALFFGLFYARLNRWRKN